MAIRILDIGQCGFDGPRMASLWQRSLGAEVDSVDSGDDALRQLDARKYDVVLVNRILAADGSSGLAVIQQLKDADITLPVMLVSDLAEAQDAAVALGALRGFGKAQLGEPEVLELIRGVARTG
jgi:DNA-binding response OmpR family regulator